MLIKSADGKFKDIEILQGLLNHPAATADLKRRIKMEICSIRLGEKGEKEAAHEINFHFGETRNWAVIHDLRIEHGARSAQIDHIIVDRFLEVWVCESKWFAEGIAINEHGECSFFSDGKPRAMSSPFEQNRKHCTVLKAACRDGAIQLPKRFGLPITPSISSLVLVSKNARIERPSAKVKGVDDILKVDQLKERIDKDCDNDYNVLNAAKIISSDTLEGFARRLAALHNPIAFDWHAKFGLSTGVTLPATIQSLHAAQKAGPPVCETQKERKMKSKPVCSSCEKPVPDNEAEYCRFHKAKFGGNVYCWDCQKNVSAIV